MAAALLVCSALTGCATYSQVFINADGEVRECASTGQGIIGMAMASSAVDGCSKNMRAAGFLEIERAGVVGITLSDPPPGSALRILKVVPGSPADSVGVVAGDILEAVESLPVQSPKDASRILFGEWGIPVRIGFRRDSTLYNRIAIRAPFKKVFGTKASGAGN